MGLTLSSRGRGCESLILASQTAVVLTRRTTPMANLTTAQARKLGILPPSMPKLPPRPADGFKSKWEREYARHLAFEKSAGTIRDFGYEKIRLWIGKRSDRPGAKDAWLTLDFYVIECDGSLSFREVKGHWREAAKVRTRTAAAMYPFTIRVVRKSRTGWDTVETFNAAADPFAGKGLV